MKRSLLTALLLLSSPLWAQIEPPKTVERVTASGATIAVDSSAAANAALAAAQPGSTIVLDSTKVFRALVVPDGKAGITLRPSGESVVIESDGAAKPALAVGLGTSDLSFQRLTFQSTNAGTTAILYILVRCGYDQNGQVEAKTVEQLPNRVEFLGCRFLGVVGGNTRIGLLANANNLYLKDCIVREVHEKGAESQGVLRTNANGSMLMENCDIEAAGIGALFGGSQPTIPGLQLADIAVKNCRFSKKPEWKGVWLMKGAIEWKGGVRVLATGNRFENVQLDAQQGMAMLLTPRNGHQIAHVLIEDNLFVNNSGGIHVAATDDNSQTDPVTGPVAIRNNTFINIGSYPGLGRIFNVSTADGRMIESLEITGNRGTISPTSTASTAVLFFEGPAAARAVKRLEMTANAFNFGKYGCLGSNTVGGKATFDKWTESWQVENNVFFGGASSAAAYPGNWFSP